jgi:hypothetical protein
MSMFVVLIFVMQPDGSAQMVKNIETREKVICLEMTRKINDDKSSPFNAACYVRTKKHI